MTQHYYIDGTFDQELIKVVLFELGQFNPEEPLKIYLTSLGGHMFINKMLIDFLGSFFKNEVIVVCAGHVVSAAWRFVLEQDFATVEILEGTYTLDHLITVVPDEIRMKMGHTDLSNINQHQENLQRLDTEWIGRCEKEFGYTKEECDRFLSDKDVTFTHNRVQEILNIKNGTIKERKVLSKEQSSSEEKGSIRQEVQCNEESKAKESRRKPTKSKG